MKNGWYDKSNYIVRTSGITEQNGWHMTTEEINDKYGCENYEEFCRLFKEAEENDPEKYMQMVIDIGPKACEEAYRTAEAPEYVDMLIKRRIRAEKGTLGFIYDKTPKGVFQTLPHGRQVQIVYINQLIINGMCRGFGLAKKTKRDIEDSRREANEMMSIVNEQRIKAESIERRGRKMIATALKMQSRKEPHGRQKQQLRALGFMA